MSPSPVSEQTLPSGFVCLLQLLKNYHAEAQWSGVLSAELMSAYEADSQAAILELSRRMELSPEAIESLEGLNGKRGPAIMRLQNGEYAVLANVAQFAEENVVAGGLSADKKWCVNRFPREKIKAQLTGQGVLLNNLKDFDNVRHSSVWALSAIARHHRIPLEPHRIIHDYAVKTDELSKRQILRIGSDNNLKIGEKALPWKVFANFGRAFPAMIAKKDGKFAVACGWNAADNTLAILDPAETPANGQRFSFWKEEDYAEKASGRGYLIKRKWHWKDADRPFGLGWFIPEFLKQKGVFTHIAFAVLMINAIALATPLFFQIIVDKVLVNQSYSTLQVLVTAICAILFFNAVMEFLRGYLLLFATNKIDISTATAVFNKLMHLPIDFFERVPSGVLLKHVQQTEKIRGFLSGSLFFTLLELTSLFIFVPFLLLYSVKLTMVVLGFSLAIAAVIAVLIKPFQRRLNELYEAEGKRQAMLVESIHGMRTVKSLSLEPVEKEAWEDSTAYAVNAYFRVGKISVTAKSLSQLLEMLMGVCVIWLGALSVFDGTLSVGALIAFQMISNRVTGPLVRLVGLIHEYQQVAISVKMLGVVMNTTSEPAGGGVRNSIKGNITFEHVNFQYTLDGPVVLRDLNFTLEPGGVYGIVGRSGSGKTTLTKLLQGLYPTNSGLVKVDGIDIREYDKVFLRNSIGVVLQENYFFSGTVKENLSLTRRNATHDEVIAAARLAGADEFVQNLPKGYDTMLEENASNLSGGQKQRLAIARALLTNPRILIFDEATSALDPESENVIQENLPKLAAGRTVLVISHRLSIVSGANRTIVLDKGQLTDFGSHRELLSRPGIYKDFWYQQMERNINR